MIAPTSAYAVAWERVRRVAGGAVMGERASFDISKVLELS